MKNYLFMAKKELLTDISCGAYQNTRKPKSEIVVEKKGEVLSKEQNPFTRTSGRETKRT